MSAFNPPMPNRFPPCNAKVAYFGKEFVKIVLASPQKGVWVPLI
jgi:hypothetical protein